MRIPDLVTRMFGGGRTGGKDLGERRMVDVDTRRRDAVTQVLRPDSLSAAALASGTREVDPVADADTVRAAIIALHGSGALDEFVPDTVDGLIAGWLAVWDGHVDEHLNQQVLTSLRLAGQELENVTACLATVRALRVELADVDHEVGNWRGVLRGEITALPFPVRPAPAEEDADLADLLGGALLAGWGREALDRTPDVADDTSPATPLLPVPRHLPHPDVLPDAHPDLVVTTREEHA
jgi:hypothetical protein